MRTNEERQYLIHRRTLEIKREQRRRKQRLISGTGIAACLAIIVGIGYVLPGVTKQASISKINYVTGMASMLGRYEALGYICIGILSFALGVCVTVLLYRIRKAEEHKQRAEKYNQLEQEHENKMNIVAIRSNSSESSLEQRHKNKTKEEQGSGE